MALGLCAAEPPASSEPIRIVYRMRGEVRPLFFWRGRDDVGGGHIAIRRVYSSSQRRRDEIEVLFGSLPERIPGHVNRWGHGSESADWILDGDTPRLLSTEFQGLMRHSPENSIAEVLGANASKGEYVFDVIRSRVALATAESEIRAFFDKEDFHFRNPERLLARYRDSLATMPPLRRAALTNTGRRWSEPNGFLTALSRLIGDVLDAADLPVQQFRRMRPSTVFVFNAKLYDLRVTGVQWELLFQPKYGPERLHDVAVLDFQCFNTTRRTRTDFTLWIPTTGGLKGLPVRISLQPRWWLRLQLDADLNRGKRL
jgi:hypothetical protein